MAGGQANALIGGQNNTAMGAAAIAMRLVVQDKQSWAWGLPGLQSILGQGWTQKQNSQQGSTPNAANALAGGQNNTAMAAGGQNAANALAGGHNTSMAAGAVL